MNIDYNKSALVMIDIQNDFCPAYTGKSGREYPAGALAVNDGHEVIGPLNKLSGIFREKGGKILATKDWHPDGHVSFAASHSDKTVGDIIYVPVSEDAVESFKQDFHDLVDQIPELMQQVLWPVHCVQDTNGADFHEDLDTQNIDFIFPNGHHKNIDSYSAFFESDRCTPTGLYTYLKEQNLDTVIIGGLATDYCVYYSVIDAIKLGLKVYLITDACRGIDMPAGTVKNTLDIMKNNGAVFVTSEDF